MQKPQLAKGTENGQESNQQEIVKEVSAEEKIKLLEENNATLQEALRLTTQRLHQTKEAWCRDEVQSILDKHDCVLKPMPNGEFGIFHNPPK